MGTEFETLSTVPLRLSTVLPRGFFLSSASSSWDLEVTFGPHVSEHPVTSAWAGFLCSAQPSPEPANPE